MRFANPWILLALTLVPLWFWRHRSTSRRGGLKFSSVPDPAPLTSLWTTLGPGALLVLRALALLLFVIALARPQVGKSESKVKTEGIDIVLAVDVSGSMQAMDFKLHDKETDRLTVVKQVVKEFIHSRPNDRIGMVAFAGRAYVASPLTLDHDWLDRNLERIKIGLIEDGTAIGSGLGTAVNRLRDTKARSKVIILLTDGVENVRKVMPLDAARAAQQFGVRVYTIGAGTKGFAKMPVFDRNTRQLRAYHQMMVEIDEELLKEISSMTGGQYFRATDTDSLRQIYEQIDKMEKREVETIRFEEWRELFPRFLVPGLACLLAAVVLEHTRLRRLP
jgi:Ca-activated chloride channel family protein